MNLAETLKLIAESGLTSRLRRVSVSGDRVSLQLYPESGPQESRIPEMSEEERQTALQTQIDELAYAHTN